MKISLAFLANILLLFRKVFDRLLMVIFKPLFKRTGRNVKFFPLNSTFSYKTISIGDDVFIGDRAYFYASVSSIQIGNKVMFGPHVTIRGGNHSSHIIGKYLFDYRLEDKLISDDEPVIIEDDVWVGTNVTILKGVRISTGSIVAAGSLVTKDVEPYSIYGGVPAKKIKDRFSLADLEKHKELINEMTRK